MNLLDNTQTHAKKKTNIYIITHTYLLHINNMNYKKKKKLLKLYKKTHNFEFNLLFVTKVILFNKWVDIKS